MVALFTAHGDGLAEGVDVGRVAVLIVVTSPAEAGRTTVTVYAGCVSEKVEPM
jgi:hypothetical protein